MLPQKCRAKVLELAHQIPLAGHLGRDKTADRLLYRFYWPTLYKDVGEYCRQCEVCQKTRSRKPRRAPLIPLPILEEPFQRIGMDIVGPLPRSARGHQYILVVTDYATRYPEAVPMKNIDADRVAEELVNIFSRVGLPKEILTDQGTNFQSQLLQEIHRLLQVTALRTTPYHPQTDGLTERFNQTLKSMLRKFATKEGKDWDRLIPYLLFTYREVPQASTGFSPFELLYGRSVRGPLDVLKESWEARKKSSESVVSYVLLMRERMEAMVEEVQKNCEKAQKKQKQWYDENAREREFQVGDYVLVLLPDSTQKLFARWQGPYVIKRKVGDVDYQVDKKKQYRVLHVNLLSKWHALSTAYAAEVVEEFCDEEILAWNDFSEGKSSYTTGKLNESQSQQLYSLLSDYDRVLQPHPGKTDLVEHRIYTPESARPVHQPPYRLPYAYRERVKKELQEMLAAGIIEPSSSEWSSPLVVVHKEDGSLRLCVDYRRLNTVTQPDAYPMPRVDELLDRLGKATYLSTIDLARGYWQVPVSPPDRYKTAFTTPYGFFQFKRMPFGLSGAPATFQRMMDQLTNDMEFAAAYMDDLVVYSNTWEEHLQHLQATLQRLQTAGLTAKPNKCQFAFAECTHLGHIVGGGQVKPLPSKLQAIQDFPTPTTKKQVRTFLGLTGYYRRFINGYASMSAILSDLTRAKQPNNVKWTPKTEEAFRQLKRSLCTSPVLMVPNFDRPFLLQTDASDRGVGGVLSQINEEGRSIQ